MLWELLWTGSRHVRAGMDYGAYSRQHSPLQGTESAHLSLRCHESIQPFKDKMENQTSSQVSRTMCEHCLASGLVLGMKTFRGQVQVPTTVESNQVGIHILDFAVGRAIGY